MILEQLDNMLDIQELESKDDDAKLDRSVVVISNAYYALLELKYKLDDKQFFDSVFNIIAEHQAYLKIDYTEIYGRLSVMKEMPIWYKFKMEDATQKHFAYTGFIPKPLNTQ